MKILKNALIWIYEKVLFLIQFIKVAIVTLFHIFYNPMTTKIGTDEDISGETFPKKSISNYDDIRDSIRTGDLIFCSGNYWGSKEIRSATKSLWSHVAIIFKVKAFNRVMVLESILGKGVRTIPLSRYIENFNNTEKPYNGAVILARHGKYESLITQNVPNTTGTTYQDIFTEKAVNMLGCAYDNSVMRAFTFITVMAKAGLDPNIENKKNKEYVCSEFVQECFEKISLGMKKENGAFLSPADFAGDPDIKLTHVLVNPPDLSK